MPRIDVDTRREREHIEDLVSQLLARYVQVSRLVDGKGSSWQIESFQRSCSGPQVMSDLRAWKLTMAIVLARVDRDIHPNAWRATAHRLIRNAQWSYVAELLGVDGYLAAKDIVVRTTARLYAEIVARDLDEASDAMAA